MQTFRKLPITIPKRKKNAMTTSRICHTTPVEPTNCPVHVSHQVVQIKVHPLKPAQVVGKTRDHPSEVILRVTLRPLRLCAIPFLACSLPVPGMFRVWLVTLPVTVPVTHAFLKFVPADFEL
jgi:hypothetical protein